MNPMEVSISSFPEMEFVFRSFFFLVTELVVRTFDPWVHGAIFCGDSEYWIFSQDEPCMKAHLLLL